MTQDINVNIEKKEISIWIEKKEINVTMKWGPWGWNDERYKWYFSTLASLILAYPSWTDWRFATVLEDTSVYAWMGWVWTKQGDIDREYNKQKFFAMERDFGGSVSSDSTIQWDNASGWWPLVVAKIGWWWTDMRATNAWNGSRCAWRFWIPWTIFLWTLPTIFEAWFEIVGTQTVLHTHTIRVWLISSTSAESSDCVYIRESEISPNFELVTRSNNNETSIDSWVLVEQSKQYKTKIVATTNSVDFYMSEYWSELVFVWNIQDNIPTAWVMQWWQIIKTLWTLTHKLSMDYYSLVQYLDR